MSEQAAGSTVSEPSGWRQRLDHSVYAAEQALITGALLVMTATYFLQIVHREMQAEVNAFDKLILRLMGFPTINLAKQVDGLVASVTGLYTPASLAAVAWVMAILALRTRSRVGDRFNAKGFTVFSVKPLVQATVIVAGIYGLTMLVDLLSARVMCLVVLTASVIPAAQIAFKSGRIWGLLGLLVGAGSMVWFIFARVEQTYVWSSELSSVLLMYVGFLGGSMATKDGKHISVDAVRKKIPPRYAPLYNGVGGLVTVAFCVLLLMLSLHYMAGRLEHGVLLEATQLPEIIVSLPIALSLLLMICRFSARCLADFSDFRHGVIREPSAPELH